ncbi:MAG: cell division protein FtsQ/DivIB [Paramuribaculum sp.]
MALGGKIKRSWLYAALTLVVVAYIVVMWNITAGKSDDRLCSGILITVHDTAKYRFVTPEELARELGDLPANATRIPLKRINIDSLERVLKAFDKIEDVNVTVLSNGKIHIDVTPMHPVVRIFSPDGSSYYVNREGKRIKADARYHLDLPVVVGDFDNGRMPVTSLIPLVDRLSADSLLSDLVSMIKVDSPDDIILVPVVRGHVINIGDTLDYPDKFRRIRTMYTQVLKVRGWEMYDTISVKYRGQIVATRRNKELKAPEIVIDETFTEIDDDETMLVSDSIAPGQARVGAPVENDHVTPASKKSLSTAN